MIHRGKPWWFVLPAEWHAAQPLELAQALLSRERKTPEQMARLLGCERFFPFTDDLLGRWSLELKRQGRDPSLLPNPGEMMARSNHLPEMTAPPEYRDQVAHVFRLLAPLLGLEVAQQCLHTMLLPYREWMERKPWYQSCLERLSAELDREDNQQRWQAMSEAERVETFVSFMGPGRGDLRALEIAISGGRYKPGRRALRDQGLLQNLARIWCGPMTSPTEHDFLLHLALGLAYPKQRFGPHTMLERNLEKLLALKYFRLSAEKLELLNRLGTTRELQVEGISVSALEPPEIEQAIKEELHGALAVYGDPLAIRRSYRLLRTLNDWKIPGLRELLQSVSMRDSNRNVWAYLVSLALHQPPTAEQWKTLQEVFPRMGFTPEWLQAAPYGGPEVEELAGLFSLDRSHLSRYFGLRVALGKSALSKEFARWQAHILEAEKAALSKLSHLAPTARRLSRLDTLKPDKNECKRRRKELRLGLEMLPQQLWQQHIERLRLSLLDRVLGKETARQVPRAGQLLRLSAVPLESLRLLRQEHPANLAWLAAFDHAGHSAAHWLDGLCEDIYLGEKFVELRTETRPAEVLEMGTHFETCLSLEDGFNAHSALTNLLEANKMVIMGRDLQQTVVVRKLIAVNLRGEMVGYHTYSHLPGAERAVDEACRKFALKAGLSLSNSAVPERIIEDLEWYDDGVCPWLEPIPPQYPEGWPQDREAVNQWRALQWAEGHPPDGDPRGSAEIFHQLKTGLPLKDNPSEAFGEDHREALRCLMAEGRYDILAQPRVHRGEVCEMPDLLARHGGLRVEQADDYAALLNPQHRLYRGSSLEEYDYRYIQLSPVFCFAPAKTIRNTCIGLCQAGYLDAEDPFFLQMLELLFLAFLRCPNDQGWHRFEGKSVARLLVGVGCRLPTPCWLGTFRKATEMQPDWDMAWLARARVEGPKIASILQDHLRRRPRSLTLAQAVLEAGEHPDGYLLPEPEVLCDPLFLDIARPLHREISARLDRLARRGYDARTLAAARKHLAPLDVGQWHKWPGFVADPRLDLKLSRQVVTEGRYQHVGAWLKHGLPSARLGYLRLVDAQITDLNRERLQQNFAVGASGCLHDALTELWLHSRRPHAHVTEYHHLFLALQDFPDLLERGLESLDFSQKAEALDAIADYLTDEQLQELFRRAFPARDRPVLSDHTDFFKDCQRSVRVQKLILNAGTGPLSHALKSTERGRWCWEQHSHSTTA